MSVKELMEEHTKAELVNMARDMDLSGYSSLNKEGVAALVNEAMVEEAEAEDVGEVSEPAELKADGTSEVGAEPEEKMVTIQTTRPVTIRIRGVVDVPMERNMPVATEIEVPTEYADEVKRVLKGAYGEDVIK